MQIVFVANFYWYVKLTRLKPGHKYAKITEHWAGLQDNRFSGSINVCSRSADIFHWNNLVTQAQIIRVLSRIRSVYLSERIKCKRWNKLIHNFMMVTNCIRLYV